MEQELRRRLRGLRGPNPAVSQSAYHAFAAGGNRMSLKYRALAGAAAAALAVIGGAVAATAATGSPDPALWGET